MRELVETGRIAELEELRQTVSPELAALRPHARTRVEPARRDRRGARGPHRGRAARAAAAGRLREAPGVGPEAPRRGSSPRSSRPARRRRGPAHARAGPAALSARSRRRRSTASSPATRAAGSTGPGRLAVVVPAERPDEVRARFAALPEIVAMLDAGLGVSLDGIPVELVVAPPERLGTALVRATGSDGVRRRARAAARGPRPRSASTRSWA